MHRTAIALQYLRNTNSLRTLLRNALKNRDTKKTLLTNTMRITLLENNSVTQLDISGIFIFQQRKIMAKEVRC